MRPTMAGSPARSVVARSSIEADRIAAHQVGTPLNLISGYVQMVRESNADPRTRERLEIVERQIQGIGRTLDALIDAKLTRAASPDQEAAAPTSLVAPGSPRAVPAAGPRPS